LSAPEKRIRKGAKEGSNWNDKNLVKAARLSGDSRERREENNNSPAFNSTANQDNKARGKKRALPPPKIKPTERWALRARCREAREKQKRVIEMIR